MKILRTISYATIAFSSFIYASASDVEIAKTYFETEQEAKALELLLSLVENADEQAIIII